MAECFVMMTEDNISGREIVFSLLSSGINISGILVERSIFSDKLRNFLENPYYSPPSVYDMVIDKGIPLYFVSDHNNLECLNLIKKLNVKVIILGGTRCIKKEVIDAVSIGIINIHPGILPEYRGCDVVGWSILNGGDIGATSHFITEEYDMGPILLKRKLKYIKGETLLKVRIDVMRLCGRLAVETILKLEKIIPKEQKPEDGHRYYVMNEEELKKVEEKINDV